MEIRLARQEDLPQINKIYNQAVRQRFCTAHLEEVSLKDREQWFAAHSSSAFPVFVAVLEAQVVGWASLGPYREDRQALAHGGEVSYYVDEKNRGRGIGNSLLTHAIRQAPAYMFSVLVAILLDKNPASIGLLQKFGFKEWGRMPGIAIIDDQEADHLFYGLRL